MKTAVILKMVNDAMFAMVSSCSARVAVRGDRCLGGQFPCAQVHYGIFFTIVDVQIDGWGVFFGNEKGFDVGINIRHRRIRYFQPQPLTTMVFLARRHQRHLCHCMHTVGPRSAHPRARAPSIHHGRCLCALV